MKTRTYADLDCVVLDTAPDPMVSIIWLHGLGADAHDFVPIVPQLKSAQAQPVRFIFPNAPIRPVTVNGGVSMRAWYDILGIDIDRNQDTDGIQASVTSVEQIITETAVETPHGVVLAGFSQGGAIALRTALGSSSPILGVIGLSTYLLGADQLNQWVHPARIDCPIFMGHGQQDPIVPMTLAQASCQALEQSGHDVVWHTWPMGHAVCPPEITAIDRFLEKVIF